jgi:hypothetical protein
MKLSNETLNVLKNFSAINQGIQFKKGTKLSTVSAGKTVLAQAILKDEFPQDFCIYDLNQFLSVNSLFKETAELEFDESNITFKSGRSKIKYRMTAKEMIVTPPEKELTLPSVDVKFTLTSEDYDTIMKTAAVLSSPHIAIKSENDKITLVAFDAVDNSAHTNSIEVGDAAGGDYTIVFKTENIKMIPGSYEVEFSFKGIGHFKNTKEDIQYWIASEAKESLMKSPGRLLGESLMKMNSGE